MSYYLRIEVGDDDGTIGADEVEFESSDEAIEAWYRMLDTVRWQEVRGK